MRKVPPSIKDELLPIDEIKNNILTLYNLKNAAVLVLKFKDTEKQRAVYRIDVDNKSFCLKKFTIMKRIFCMYILLWNGAIEIKFLFLSFYQL